METGVFCLEGEWDGDLRSRDSVEPLLELLGRLNIAKTIRRDVATEEELEYYLGKFALKGYAEYRVLFMAAHGVPGELALGRDTVSMDRLAEMPKGKCAGRVIYFGSCLTLKLGDTELREFAKETGTKAIVGYSKSIPWVESAAFDVLLLERLCQNNRTDAFFNRLIKEHGDFANTSAWLWPRSQR